MFDIFRRKTPDKHTVALDEGGRVTGFFDPPATREAPPRIPACLSHDDVEEESDFGRQLLMIIRMSPSKVSFEGGFHRFKVEGLGSFTVSDGGEVRSVFPSSMASSFTARPTPRLLTAGDQKAIVAELRLLLTSAQEVAERSATEILHQQQMQHMKASALNSLTAHVGDAMRYGMAVKSIHAVDKDDSLLFSLHPKP